MGRQGRLPEFMIQHFSAVALDYQNGIFSGEDKIIADLTGKPPNDGAGFRGFAPRSLQDGERRSLTHGRSRRPSAQLTLVAASTMIGALTVSRIMTDRDLSTASHQVTWSRNHSDERRSNWNLVTAGEETLVIGGSERNLSAVRLRSMLPAT
jgi:hypothetical protein